MLILALDLSLNCTGYAVLEYKDKQLDIVERGIINNKNIPAALLGKKLERIDNKLNSLFDKYQFQAIVREASFSNKNVKSTQRLFMTLGIVYENCHKHGQDKVIEIAPTTVKKLVGGSGKCTKEEVADNLMYYVGYKNYETDDISDAVAVGIAYFKQQKYEIKLKHMMVTEE